MNHGLALLSKLRVPRPAWLVAGIYHASRLLAPFGTDVGGMVVSVVGQWPDGWQRRDWRLCVQGGEGPFMPAVAARVIVRKARGIAHGARPALASFSAAEFDAAIDDIAATVTREVAPLIPLFERHLGDGFAQLRPPVRAAHQVYGPRICTGRARVTRGTALLSRLIATVMRFPAAADDVAVTVAMMPDDGAERWVRTFDGKAFRSTLRMRGDCMTERFGPMTFELDLHVQDGALHYPARMVLGHSDATLFASQK